MRKTIGQHIGSQFSDAELPDLLPSFGQLPDRTLVAHSDEPVLFQALNSHALAIVDHSDRRVLIVHVGRMQDENTTGSGVERIGNKLLYCLVGTGVEALGKQLNYAVT